MIDFDIQEPKSTGIAVSIKVIGIGGAGCNTVNSMINSGCKNIDFVVVNTDVQALELSKAKHKLQIGIKSTKGLGTGANPELGRQSAEEDLDKIIDVVRDADIVFLSAGMGGGTGSGAIPVIAKALRAMDVLTVAVVTRPFVFEGKRRARVADAAIASLTAEVDTLIVIPNQKLLDVVDQNVSMIDAFAMINQVLSHSVIGISDIIAKPGHINVDFADVRAIMKNMGHAVMGTGRASGADRARQAALQAISSPLLENLSVKGAHGVLLNITGGKDLGLHEVSAAASIIYEQAHEDANIILGSVFDEAITDEVIVTIIATGFDHDAEIVQQPVVQASVESVEPVTSQATASEASSLQSNVESSAGYARMWRDQYASQLSKKSEHTQDQSAAEQELNQVTHQAASELLVAEDTLDVPTFMRNQSTDSDSSC